MSDNEEQKLLEEEQFFIRVADGNAKREKREDRIRRRGLKDEIRNFIRDTEGDQAADERDGEPMSPQPQN